MNISCFISLKIISNLHSQEKMPKVFLVTKLKTTNLGNQALSMELIKLFEESIGKENLYVAGRPLGLFGYSIDALKNAIDPKTLFESWADSVVRKYKPQSSPRNVFVSKVNSFKLTENKSLAFEKFKEIFRPIKRKFDKLFLFNKQYVKRLDGISGADYFIYSGAGEVSDNHVFLRQLLEIRIAQKLGVKTGAVNQSVVVKHDAFKKIVHLVYGNMHHIVVRGEISKATVVSFGVDANKISIAPDTAIKTTCNLSGIKKNGKVGINITPFIKYEWKDVERVIGKLKSYNRDLVFITNEPMGDVPVIEKFKNDYKIDVLPESSDYREFAKKIAPFEYLIGARLHTNVISLAVNVPVIAIEGLVWKTKELFEQFEYPLPSVNVEEPGWADSIINSIEKIEEHKIDFQKYFSETLAKHKTNVRNNVSWITND